jgi:fatty acid desaturase
MSERSYKDLTGAITLISVGIIFLLNTTGILSWNVWEYIFRFWPFMLILVGIKILLPNNKTSSITIAVIYLLAIAYVFISAYYYSVGQSLPFFTNQLNDCIFNGCKLN